MHITKILDILNNGIINVSLKTWPNKKERIFVKNKPIVNVNNFMYIIQKKINKLTYGKKDHKR